MKYFKLYFDSHREDGLVWEVAYSNRNHVYKIRHFKEVWIDVPVKTVYYGKNADQPKAVIKGKCIEMKIKNNKLYIT